jgi:adenylate kinase family enzyme/GNAT superfamily N-acetyltransferase
MKPCRIHILGASGSGTTALGRAVAGMLAIPHHDTDDYFWLPTVPPYRTKRAVADRLRLMHEMFLERRDWVLSGSLDGWGDELVPRFDLVAFVSAPTAVRVARLRAREARHFGAEAVRPGGWHHLATEEFIAWASHYEDGTLETRTRKRHEAWLETLSCPVLRLDGTRPTADLVAEVLQRLRQPGDGGVGDGSRIDLRPAAPADYAYCASMYFAGMEASIRSLQLDPVLHENDLRQRWTAAEVRVIRRDGADVGWVQSRSEDGSVFIAQLFVEGPLQGRGIGTAIVRRIIADAGRAARSVTLGVVKTNPALRLYRRLGFRITHEDDRKFYMRRDADAGPDGG